MDGLYLLQGWHLETAPAPVKVHQRPFNVMAYVLERVRLEVVELRFQLLARFLENKLQRLALV
jgi:hypothetical protein